MYGVIDLLHEHTHTHKHEHVFMFVRMHKTTYGLPRNRNEKLYSGMEQN